MLPADSPQTETTITYLLLAQTELESLGVQRERLESNHAWGSREDERKWISGFLRIVGLFFGHF